MSFLAPLSLFFGLLAIPIIIMYMLRLRRREVTISSTMLWQSLARDREANAPWQKLRRNLLLLLQLLILAALVMALARPFLPVDTPVNRSVVVLLDASASMQATDLPDITRFDQAKQQAESLVSALSGNNRMTLIEAGAIPRVLVASTSDKQALYEALDTAVPGNASADWEAAFALAAGAAQGLTNGRIAIISDGGLPDELPPLPADAVYIPIGESGENLSVSALATRDTADGVQLFAGVTNHGALAQTAVLGITIDGTLYDARRIELPPGETADFTWELPDNAAVITAALSDQLRDNLALDDTAATVHAAGPNTQILLVGDGNIFLEQIFAVLPGLEAFSASPDVDLNAPDAPVYDLYVFDGVPLPDPVPAGDLLIINPPPTAADDTDALLQVTGVVTGTTQTAAVQLADSPILQFVAWNDVNVSRMKQISADWAQSLITAEGGPLVLAGERNGRRIAAIAFALDDSDLPLRVTFPILITNLVNWLTPGRAFDAPEQLRPGDVVTIPPHPTATEIIIIRPDGTQWRTDLGEDAQLFTGTDQVGVYTVTLVDGTGEQDGGRFAVNLFAPQESRISPRSELVVGTTTVGQQGGGDNIGQWEFWPWLAAVALAILLIEWWVYHRGTRRPQLPTQKDLWGWMGRIRNR